MTASPKVDWTKLPDEELLRLRMRDLGLKIPGSILEQRVARLYEELDQKGIVFHPTCYLADEWLTPDKVPIIGIPFYLAHPRLISLEKKMMLEAEGSGEEWCMRLLRHEAGHALNYAYRLFSHPEWTETFGPFDAPYYHVTYNSKPYSKRFVIHLEENYAQAHPDEDFAETFAVWLSPPGDWRHRYRGWPALKKLEYVDALMAKVGPAPLKVKRVSTPWSSERMTSTLQEFYHRKQKYLGAEFPGFYDPGLKRIFAPPDEGAPPERALHFLRRHRKALLRAVSPWASQRKYDISRLLEKLLARCEHLDLRLKGNPQDSLLETAAFVAAILASFRRFNGVHRGK